MWLGFYLFISQNLFCNDLSRGEVARKNRLTDLQNPSNNMLSKQCIYVIMIELFEFCQI